MLSARAARAANPFDGPALWVAATGVADSGPTQREVRERSRRLVAVLADAPATRCLSACRRRHRHSLDRDDVVAVRLRTSADLSVDAFVGELLHVTDLDFG